MDSQLTPGQVEDNAGIDLGQVVAFLSDHWKKALVGALAGLVIGVAGWMALASYVAESVLMNNKAVDFISWRNLQKSLPVLAAQMLEANKVAPEDVAQFEKLSSMTWWQKNVVPTYSLNKADTKDLAAISKDMQDTAGTTILNLVVTARGASKANAASNVGIVTRFIKQGSAYLSIESLINVYESRVLNSAADLRKRILDAEVELKYLRERARNLESLRQRFPANASVGGQQVVDLKDSSAKFMPISTQLVAVSTDINNTVESLQRMRDQLAQLQVLRTFIEKAKPLVDQEFDGLVLADSLLKIEAAVRQEIAPEDMNALQLLNGIHFSLMEIKTSFTKGLYVTLDPQLGKSGPLLPASGGFFAGLVLTLALILGRKVLAGVRRPDLV